MLSSPSLRHSLHRLVFRLVTLILCAAASPHAFAQPGDVSVNLTANKVVVADDGKKESIEPAAKARPGDLIEYDAVYRDASKATVRNLQATVPVPQGLAFVAESAKPADALASVDGKNFEPIPLMREVKKADGTTEKQAVPLSEYRALRWTIFELPSGASETVSLRARVLTNPGK